MEIDGRHVGMKYLERTNMCVFVPSIIKLHLKQKENRTKKKNKTKTRIYAQQRGGKTEPIHFY